MKKSLIEIKKIYEKDLKKFGPNNKGVGWKNKKEATKRYEIMSGLMLKAKKNHSVIDLGCGLSDLYKHLKSKKFKTNYTGIDLSEKMINICKIKYPKNNYYCLDILYDHKKIPKVDYIIINGLFTQKGNYSNSKMFKFLKSVLQISWKKTKVGLAFKVMSEYVDWKNRKNFYLNLNKITDFINNNLGKKFIINHSYGLHEYTIFIYKKI